MKAVRGLIVAVGLFLATAGILLAALSSPFSALGQSKQVDLLAFDTPKGAAPPMAKLEGWETAIIQAVDLDVLALPQTLTNTSYLPLILNSAMPAVPFPVMPGGFLEEALTGVFSGTTVIVDGGFTYPSDIYFLESVAPLRKPPVLTLTISATKSSKPDSPSLLRPATRLTSPTFRRPVLAACFVRQGYIIDPTTFISQDWLYAAVQPMLARYGHDGRPDGTHGRRLASLQWQEPRLVPQRRL